MNDNITFTGDLTEDQIYQIWLALTNGGEESPVIETDEFGNHVLKIADNQQYCIVTGADKDGDTALQIAEAICKAGGVITQLKNRIMFLEEEHKRLTDWVNDLQSGMYVNCVYCGHRYGPAESTPVSMADVLKKHIEQCPKHPLNEARKTISRMCDGVSRILRECDNEEANEGEVMYFAPEKWLREILEKPDNQDLNAQ